MSTKNLSTRDRILDSCKGLLETGGASAIRMSDIAKLAGISRQALYLHFPNRAELLVATTRHLDVVHQIESAVDNKMMSVTGKARLDGFIDIWGNYIPHIYGVGKALLAIKDTDAEAEAAWHDRMEAVRHLCKSVVESLSDEGLLANSLTKESATDLLWTICSIQTWEQLTQDCGWTQANFLKHIRDISSVTLTGRWIDAEER